MLQVHCISETGPSGGPNHRVVREPGPTPPAWDTANSPGWQSHPMGLALCPQPLRSPGQVASWPVLSLDEGHNFFLPVVPEVLQTSHAPPRPKHPSSPRVSWLLPALTEDASPSGLWGLVPPPPQWEQPQGGGWVSGLASEPGPGSEGR